MEIAEVCAEYMQSDGLPWPDSKYRVCQIQKDLEACDCWIKFGLYTPYSFDLDLKP